MMNKNHAYTLSVHLTSKVFVDPGERIPVLSSNAHWAPAMLRHRAGHWDDDNE